MIESMESVEAKVKRLETAIMSALDVMSNVGAPKGSAAQVAMSGAFKILCKAMDLEQRTTERRDAI